MEVFTWIIELKFWIIGFSKTSAPKEFFNPRVRYIPVKWQHLINEYLV